MTIHSLLKIKAFPPPKCRETLYQKLLFARQNGLQKFLRLRIKQAKRFSRVNDFEIQKWRKDSIIFNFC
jgi:hypothetical protein